MNWEDKIIDYIMNELPAEQMAEVQKAIKEDESVRQTFDQLSTVYGGLDRLEQTPPSDMQAIFDRNISSSTVQKTKTSSKRKYWMTVGAVVIMSLVGYSIMGYINRVNQVENELMALKNQMMEQLEAPSPSLRIKAINIGSEISPKDDKVLTAIIKKMLEDPNANVRLAASEALVNFVDNPRVTDAYLFVLDNEDDEMIVVSAINALATNQQKETIEKFNNIIRSEETPKSMKKEAELALFKLET